ncbi:site-2 protease family protein [Streptomyces sp. NPDC052000]|uniref:site-2 protease family protein n=1 Tax=Streptomyces sp. NPDC052000 TaxID=3155676 RepID=UPI00344BC232
MKESLSLGRIAGIRVGVHWSVLAVLALVTFLLARSAFPAAQPGQPAWARWSLALITSVLFLGCLLAHELAHSIVAAHHGIEVDGITLWMLGGVARLRGEPSTPAVELRISGAGPLASALAGAVFTGLTLGLGALRAPPLTVSAASWLATINFLLAAFNLLPAAPLDGGRLLHAFLWHRGGDRLRAARRSADAGRLLGWFLVLSGGATVLTGAAFSGLWAMLLGWFVITAATYEGRNAQIREVLGDLPVSEVMIRDPVTLPAAITVDALLSASRYARHRQAGYPVTGPDGRVAGLITVAHINRTPVHRRALTHLGDVMCPLADTLTTTPTERVAALLPRLEAHPLHHALVLSAPGTRDLAGIVSLADVNQTVAWLAAAHQTATAA